MRQGGSSEKNKVITTPGTLNKWERGRVPSTHRQDLQLRSAGLDSKLERKSAHTHRNSWKQWNPGKTRLNGKSARRGGKGSKGVSRAGAI